jgi:hypothetical protein
MSRKCRIMTGTEGANEILIFTILDLYFLARNAMFSSLKMEAAVVSKMISTKVSYVKSLKTVIYKIVYLKISG